jgi:phytoene synthase
MDKCIDNTLTRSLYHDNLQDNCLPDYFLLDNPKWSAFMQLQTQTWENALLSLAYEARSTDETPHQLQVDPKVLVRAYQHCEALTAIHSRSFHLASALLPAHKRRAVRALYAFCRVTDDIVDRELTDDNSMNPSGEDPRTRLQWWRHQVLQTHPAEDNLVVLAWADTRLRYRVPPRYIEQLIDGVARDLAPVRYQTFEELTAYCYGVASTVGLMSMHIIGYSGTRAIPYAIKLGVALQVTNILRDIAEDWRSGRLYLPQADLARFGLAEADLAQGVASGMVTAAWRAFMQYQIARNRQLYQEALPGICDLDSDGRFAIQAAAELYCAILRDIELHDYNVFRRRARIGGWGKLRRLPGIWWRSAGLF